MSRGNGTKYVTLRDDKRNHIYAEGERTECGIDVPIHGGAEWTYTVPEKLCADCEKRVARSELKSAEVEASQALVEELTETEEAAAEPEPAPKAKTRGKA